MEWSNQSTACGNYSSGWGRAGGGGGGRAKGCRGDAPHLKDGQGPGREASPSPRGAGRHRVQGASGAGREMLRKRAGSSQARHPQRIARWPHVNAGQAKWGPSPMSPSPRCHTDTAQAPSHHRGSAGAATSDLFSPITRALFPSPGPRLIDWNLLKTN